MATIADTTRPDTAPDPGDHMARQELPPWVDIDKLWPPRLRDEMAAVIEEGLQFVDPDGPFMAWYERAAKVANEVCMRADFGGVYNVTGTLRELIDEAVGYDVLQSIQIVLGRLDPDSIPNEDGLADARSLIAERLVFAEQVEVQP